MKPRSSVDLKQGPGTRNHTGDLLEFPVRCFTCGSVIGHLYDDYRENIKEKNPDVVLDELVVERYCCRRMFMSNVDLVTNVLRFPIV